MIKYDDASNVVGYPQVSPMIFYQIY